MRGNDAHDVTRRAARGPAAAHTGLPQATDARKEQRDNRYHRSHV